MTGRVIDDDLFGVARRLKGIDDGYFVFLNYKTGKFEIHNRRDSPSTLCLVLPYETLDERTVNKVLYTRAERVEKIVADMERENRRREARILSEQLSKAERAVGAFA